MHCSRKRRTRQLDLDNMPTREKPPRRHRPSSKGRSQPIDLPLHRGFRSEAAFRLCILSVFKQLLADIPLTTYARRPDIPDRSPRQFRLARVRRAMLAQRVRVWPNLGECNTARRSPSVEMHRRFVPEATQRISRSWRVAGLTRPVNNRRRQSPQS
jgi:hypothetical protein